MKRLLFTLFLLIVSTGAIAQGGVSEPNSTTIPLANGATFTGGWQPTTSHPSIVTKALTDQTGTMEIGFSNATCTSELNSISFFLRENRTETHRASTSSPCFRVRIINNSGADQTTLNLISMYGEQGALTISAREEIQTDMDSILTRTAEDELEIALGLVENRSLVLKFASNDDIDTADTPEDIWHGGGVYNGFPTTAAENFEVFSDSANDTTGGTGAITLRVFYLDENLNMFDAFGDPLYVDITLNGATAVNSGTLVTRIYSAKVINSGSGQTNAGILTVRWASTTSVVFAQLPAEGGQTQISNFTVPAGYRGILKSFHFSMNDNTANRGIAVIRVRDFGTNTWRNTRKTAISNDLDPYLAFFGGIQNISI